MTLAAEYAEKINSYGGDAFPDDYMRDRKGCTVIESKMIDRTRWAVIYRAVFKLDDDSYLAAEWSEGATEYQEDSYPESEAYEVRAVPVMTMKYERI